MHARHRNLLDMANMLQTKAEPKLVCNTDWSRCVLSANVQQYYRPWDLLPDEDTQIEEQLAAARTRIDEELAEFEIEKQKRLAALNGTAEDDRSGNDNIPPHPATVEAVQGESEKATNVDPAEPEPTSKPAESNENNDKEDPPSEVAGSNVVQGDADVEPNGNVDINVGRKEQAQAEAESEAEDDGDHVVEGDEDNVIY